jgi:threonine dehydrogenase-like Zn-dependent dehydrogenase
MKAVVFHGIGEISLDTIDDPKIKVPTDAIIRITASAICGTDLHMVRGTLGPMEPGTVLGHEAVGVVEQVGSAVRNFKPGDRVVIPSTIACGYCSYCRSGYYSQCDNANPNGKRAGTAFYGGPKSSGLFNGLQAEKARVPFANTSLIKLPETVTDNKAILLSDIFPTGYFGADLAEIDYGNVVAVFGCGPVGQFAIASALYMGAGRVIAVDQHQDRLEKAREQGAEIINFNVDDPVDAILEITGGIGADRVIDAVGVDAEHPLQGAAWKKSSQKADMFYDEVKTMAPGVHLEKNQWVPGNAPSQALYWAVDAIDKAGTLSIIGVYPQSMMHFPLGMALEKNLTIRMGNCNHRKYIPELLGIIESGQIDPSAIITQVVSLDSAVEAYKEFDKRKEGWLKVEIIPNM